MSSAEATISMAQYLFGILNGSLSTRACLRERALLLGTDSSVSKLSVISQRENVLNAIGALGRSSSTSIPQEEILKLFEKYFYPMIQQEVHEGLICHMLQQMASWCSRLTTVNQPLTDFFKVMDGRSK